MFCSFPSRLPKLHCHLWKLDKSEFSASVYTLWFPKVVLMCWWSVMRRFSLRSVGCGIITHLRKVSENLQQNPGVCLPSYVAWDCVGRFTILNPQVAKEKLLSFQALTTEKKAWHQTGSFGYWIWIAWNSVWSFISINPQTGIFWIGPKTTFCYGKCPASCVILFIFRTLHS